MFLKSLEINGFKSFADKTHIDFSDGITSLLGPNGCGKSNIVDSIKWVLGEQSTKSIRASNMQEVIFNGTDKRKPLPMAEVSLTIDNEEHHLQTDVPEIVIKRRIFRTGESEYYLNNQRCLLKNIKELFMDTGVGKSAYSILEQGKIDQILSNKPEDRRYIFEEAAGISRFKQKTIEAQNKIDRSNENIAQLMITFNETKKTYEKTRAQAAKALEWERLRDEAFETEVDLRLVRLKTFQLLKDDRLKKIEASEKIVRECNEKLELFNEDIGFSTDELDQIREKIQRLEVSIGSADTKIAANENMLTNLEDNYRNYLADLKNSEEKLNDLNKDYLRFLNLKEETEADLGETIELLEEREEQLEYAEGEILRFRKLIKEENELIESLEKKNSSLDSLLLTLSVKLKSVVDELVRTIDCTSSTEYSQKRRDSAENDFIMSLGRADSIVSSCLGFLSSIPSNQDYPRELLEKELKKLESELDTALTLFDTYKTSIPPVVDILLDPEGIMGEKREIEGQEKRLRDEIELNRIRVRDGRNNIQKWDNDIISLQASITTLNNSIGNLKATKENQENNIREYLKSLTDAQFKIRDEEEIQIMRQTRVNEISSKIKALDEEQLSLKENLRNLTEERHSEIEKMNSKNALLSKQRGERDRLENLRNQENSNINSQKAFIQYTDSDINGLFNAFFEKYSRNLSEFTERLDDDLPDEIFLERKLEDLNKKMQSMGNINYMAKDEFDQAEDQYKFLEKQLNDFEKTKEGLVEVLKEITEKSEALFLESYKKISENFQAMFRRLFNGGKAELKLTDEENVLSSGIEIFAQPPGKGMANLSLLSGGERSMTAVALLFATYQVKPSPFCILDEIDAALDDRNIGYFLDVLKDFARDSQFIIITHNIHTVTGGNSMLGVSQMEAGVSSAVSYKIASIKGEPVILNESEEQIEFDSEGRAKN